MFPQDSDAVQDSEVVDHLERDMLRRIARHRRLRADIQEAARWAAAYERLELQLARQRWLAL